MKKQVISDALWVDVGEYTVLRNGRIFKNRNRRNAKKRKVREVEQTKSGNGYLIIRYNGKPVLAHRFVAKAFISNPDGLPQINHKDEDKANNSVLNLEWCDPAYNINYGTHNERMSKTKCKKVYQYTLDGEFVREWLSAMEIEQELGLIRQYLSKCCCKRIRQAYGYIWSFDPPITRGDTTGPRSGSTQ